MAIDIASVGDIMSLGSADKAKGIGELLNRTADTEQKGGVSSFESLLSSAMGMIKETEDYPNAAEEAELAYMLGINDSVTDLMIAQAKANTSLQYTVAIRNAVIEAYKELMNMQF
ncbi:MAG: flagellar hook-basal body complex protein FliE [Lachnospiraceae bacterium]|nr:flagellar hook-basal body complex protein FliE [Lachnospiraceae bacterium]